MSDRPFAGIRVVEFGQFIAVPYCSQLLADGGATVVKVEPIDGDPTRHLGPVAPNVTRHFVLRNRGKRTLPLELKHPDAPRVLERLLAQADVVLTNLRPGLAGELGLDYDSLALKYPRLVVGNVTAFGRRGPDAGLAGMDLVVQARSGLMASNGRMRGDLPAIGDSPAVDYMCAVLLSFGVSSALLRRERTGRGGEVDVSLLGAALLLQNNQMVRVESIDGPAHAEHRAWLQTARAAGMPYREQAANMPTTRTTAMLSIYYRTYATKDAAIAIACVSPGLQRRLMATLGLEDRPPTDRDELADHYKELQEQCERLFAGRTTEEWVKTLNAAGIPVSGVHFPIEMLDDEQVLANGLWYDQPHPQLGTVRVLGSPVALDNEGFAPAPPMAPFASETRAVLGDVGFDDAEVDAFVASGMTVEAGGEA